MEPIGFDANLPEEITSLDIRKTGPDGSRLWRVALENSVLYVDFPVNVDVVIVNGLRFTLTPAADEVTVTYELSNKRNDDEDLG